MNQTVKGAIWTAAFFMLTEIIYKICHRRTQQRIENESRPSRSVSLSDTSLNVLFFPDKAVACTDYFNGYGCFKDKCNFSHAKTSLSKLYEHIRETRSTMDVCVFIITCKELAGILLELHKRGCKIRVITDSEQMHCDGSQIWSLLKEGIPVRTHKSSYLMHHKFAIRDGQVLINGSFNWTRQAITGNQENVIITDDHAVTSLFVKEFQRLWDVFAPISSARTMTSI